ncbi:hypothetical protein HanRHA438_Chr14g0669531 [Helianthus annuus]|nr:hypothetical protein HanIR_Chr14g0714601 [Helianthus annuus]KAJ0855083.1 hypothetical protein HanRHA438_Chr14g0669531 [Helianthus annuus]
MPSGGSRNFSHQVPFGRFSLILTIFFKSYKISTIFFNFFQTKGVPRTPKTPLDPPLYMPNLV